MAGVMRGDRGRQRARGSTGGGRNTRFGECVATSLKLVVVQLFGAISVVILDGGVDMTSLDSDRRAHGEMMGRGE